jgi:integrase
MALVKIELPRKNYSIYYRDRNHKLQHVSSGIPHSPAGDTAQERRDRAARNWRIAVAKANDLETAENGNKSVVYIRALYDAAMSRGMGIYAQNGTNGMSTRGYLDAWLELQTHLNEGRKVYQGYIDCFCAYLGTRQTESLAQLDQRDIQGFIAAQVEASLAASTINNKLHMLETSFEAAEHRGHMLSNIVSEYDYLDENRLIRKPFTVEQLAALRERWAFIGRNESEEGAVALEWITASKFAGYQGMRLGDATNQTVANIDFGEQGKGFVTWKPEKTEHLERVVTLPLHSKLHRHLLAMKNAGVQTQFTPRLAAIRRPEQCTRFKQELIATGIDPEDYKLRKRVFSAYSFHSHKHFYVDALEKALVPQDRRKLLAAHSSDEAHSRYLHAWTRNEAEVLRQDIEKVA